MSSSINTIKKLQDQFVEKADQLKQNPNSKALEQLRVEWLGKKGELTQLFEQLKSASAEEKPLIGKEINILRAKVETSLTELKSHVLEYELEKAITGSY